MDRLICGDVGFGKTEVAIRAAFKAVMDGKQVAVLAPTTVLAQQHFETFRQRMLDYPMRIEMLSRFRSPGEQKKILELLREGGVDIVIGTHRLISGDVVFKDLGLVVIDEEQRFGVLHKEKFKELFKLVDVLTLSATPIPRTLYLSLVGVKDMSTIETPPQNRLPVETMVCAYDERIIRDAINRELERQGQVFFLHNRVQTIELARDRIADLCPHARVEIGHGQMESDELEAVMARFVAGKVDVLVCTTIIESGLDIPNANTIIIDRADRFGLADLYQLRGRVGRAEHKAYAYLLLPREMMTMALRANESTPSNSTVRSARVFALPCATSRFAERAAFLAPLKAATSWRWDSIYIANCSSRRSRRLKAKKSSGASKSICGSISSPQTKPNLFKQIRIRTREAVVPQSPRFHSAQLHRRRRLAHQGLSRIAEITAHEQLDRLRRNGATALARFPRPWKIYSFSPKSSSPLRHGVSRVETRERQIDVDTARGFYTCRGQIPSFSCPEIEK